MNPFINSNPYALFGFPTLGLPPFGPGPVIRRRRSPLKQLQIFELPTNGVALSATSVDYGINPCLYNQLPCECYVTLRIRQAVPTGGEGLAVTIATPAGSPSSTVSAPGASTGTKKTPVIDHNNSPVVGSDVSELTDALALIDKNLGIIKFVNFVSGSGATGGNTPAAASARTAKTNS